MAAIDTAARIRAAALAVIERQCFGEDFGFDCALSVLQGPGGQTVMAYTLVITGKSPLLGRGPLGHVAQIPSADPPDSAVEKAVTDGLRSIREKAAGMLAGQKTPKPELIAAGK